MQKSILVTGGCGFIGSHMVEHLYRSTNWNIYVVDMLTYASKGLERLRDSGLIESSRVKIFTYDISQPLSDYIKREMGPLNYIIHMAAETHVDNSVEDPVYFIRNNVMSTTHMLEYARQLEDSLEIFFYFSTDEVYGSAPPGISYKETDRHKPTNPYSASKSAGEQICMGYENTYKIPLMMVNVMNAFGERQYVEKFIPKTIKYILDGKILPIHSDNSCKVPGSRHYIHARNIASAVLFLIQKGQLGELYHVTGEREMDNLELAEFIANVIGKPLQYEMVNFHESRPQHDTRYALCGDKLSKLGWEPPRGFEDSLKKTIQWTIDHPEWLKE